MQIRRRTLGAFTLIEVLIAVLIISLSLSTAIKAMQSMTQNSYKVQKRVLALWSADNLLKTIRLERRKLSISTNKSPCPQGRYAFTCEVKVKQSNNSRFYWVNVSVLEENQHEAANLTYLVDRFVQ